MSVWSFESSQGQNLCFFSFKIFFVFFIFVRLFVFQMKTKKKRLKNIRRRIFFVYRRQLTSKDTKRRQLTLSDKLIAGPINKQIFLIFFSLLILLNNSWAILEIVFKHLIWYFVLGLIRNFTQPIKISNCKIILILQYIFKIFFFNRLFVNF